MHRLTVTVQECALLPHFSGKIICQKYPHSKETVFQNLKRKYNHDKLEKTNWKSQHSRFMAFEVAWLTSLVHEARFLMAVSFQREPCSAGFHLSSMALHLFILATPPYQHLENIHYSWQYNFLTNQKKKVHGVSFPSMYGINKNTREFVKEQLYRLRLI